MTAEFVTAYRAVLSGTATQDQVSYLRARPDLLDDNDRDLIEGCLAVRREVRWVRATGMRTRAHERLRVVTVRPRRGRERREGTNDRQRGSRRSAGAGGGGSGDDPDSDEPPGGRLHDLAARGGGGCRGRSSARSTLRSLRPVAGNYGSSRRPTSERRIGNPMRSARARRERAEKLRAVLAAIDAGTLAVRGHDGNGAAWHEERLREHLERQIAALEGRR